MLAFPTFLRPVTVTYDISIEHQKKTRTTKKLETGADNRDCHKPTFLPTQYCSKEINVDDVDVFILCRFSA